MHSKGKETLTTPESTSQGLASPLVSSSLYGEALQVKKSAPQSVDFIPLEETVGV